MRMVMMRMKAAVSLNLAEAMQGVKQEGIIKSYGNAGNALLHCGEGRQGRESTSEKGDWSEEARKGTNQAQGTN